MSSKRACICRFFRNFCEFYKIFLDCDCVKLHSHVWIFTSQSGCHFSRKKLKTWEFRKCYRVHTTHHLTWRTQSDRYSWGTSFNITHMGFEIFCDRLIMRRHWLIMQSSIVPQSVITSSNRRLSSPIWNILRRNEETSLISLASIL